jgi:hypothetical protein
VIEITQESYPTPGAELLVLRIEMTVDRATHAFSGSFTSGPGFAGGGALDPAEPCAGSTTDTGEGPLPGWGICWGIETLEPAKFCAKWNASFVDSRLTVGTATEDVANGPAAAVSSLPAAFATFQLLTNHTGTDEVLVEGVLDREGCYEGPVFDGGNLLPAAARGHLRLELKTAFQGPNGDTWDVESVPEGNKSTDGVFDLSMKNPAHFLVPYPIDDNSWANVEAFIQPPALVELENDEHNDMTRVSAIVSQVLRAPDNGTKPSAAYLVLADDGCPNPTLVTDSCVSEGVTFIGPGAAGLPADSHWKYVAAHEIGHMIQGKFMGGLSHLYTFTSGMLTLDDPPGTPPLCRCDHVTVANSLHCLQSLERVSAAQLEGYAQFYASRIWNNAADPDCVFGYYKEFRDRTCPAGATCTPTGSDVSIFPPAPVTCKEAVKWRNNECPTPEFGTELDWMGFLYDVNTNAAAKVTMVELFGVYNQACSGDCERKVVTWDQLSQAFEDQFGPLDPRTLRAVASGNGYGVSTDIPP